MQKIAYWSKNMVIRIGGIILGIISLSIIAYVIISNKY